MAFDRGSNGSMSQINVTPLVDVMLVLLVIFMVTAPILQQGVTVDLPTVAAGSHSEGEAPTVVSVSRAGKIYLDEDEVSLDDLEAKLAEIAQAREGAPVLVRADEQVPYGSVVEVMAAVKAAGIRRVGMVTEPPRGR